MKVGIDVGYGFTKAVNENGEKIIFPSLVAPVPYDFLGDIMKGQIGYKVKIYINGEQNSFLTGEAARHSSRPIQTFNREKPARIHDTLLFTALGLLGDEENEVGIGLPLAYYTYQRQILKERLQGISGCINVDGREICFKKLKVDIFPQGAGVLFGQRLPWDGFLGVIDIGTFTTEYLLFEIKEGQPVPLLEQCGSVEAGTKMVYDAVASEFQLLTGSPVPEGMAELMTDKALKGENIYFNRKYWDLYDVARAAVSYVSLLITQKVLSVWGNKSGYISLTLLAGGGSLFFGNEIIKNLPIPAQIVEEPLFANANGYLAFIS